MENKVNKIFVKVPAKEAVDAGIKNGDLSEESLIFIEEQGRECLHTQGKDYQMVPSGGKDGQILTSHEGRGEWKYFNDLDSLTYGVEWDINVADPTLTRVGNMYYHKTLPIQSQMKGCILNAAKNKVVYWLNENDWRFRDDKEIPSIENVLINEDNTLTLVNISSGDFANKYSRYLYKGNYIRLTKRDTSTEEVFGTVANLDRDDSTGNCIVTVDWPSKYTDGTFPLNALSGGKIDLGSNLSGYDGEVMVYVPEFYIRSWEIGNKRRVSISSVNIDGSWEHQPAVFISAYRDTVLNTVPEDMGYLSTLEANTAISVANSAPYCRGGNNSSANDENEDVFKRQLGKCRTDITRATFRGYTRKAGKEILSYRQYKNIMYWLYVIEYANFNSQAGYNAALTAGFHQGGLGTGLTNVLNWKEYNGCYPISPNGYTNEFGNGTGIKLIAPLGPAPVGNVYATRWRGLENPFGDIWHNVDGIIIDADADNHPNNMNYVYTTDDPTKYGDSLADMANMVLSGLEISQNGYTKEWDLGSTAEIIPRLMGGDATQYKCDLHWTGDPDTTLRTLLLSGGADTGTYAGLGRFDSYRGVAYSATDVGFRSVLVANK